MPQEPTSKDQENNPEPDNKEITDLDAILLPKKDPVPGETLESASRANAGALLAQEQHASLPKLKPTQNLVREASTSLTSKNDETSIPALETYQGDIEKLMQKQKSSIVSIAAAEAQRRAKQPIVLEPEKNESASNSSHWYRRLIFTFLMVFVGILLLSVTASIGFVLYQKTRSIPVTQDTNTTPYITVDGTRSVVLMKGIPTRTKLIESLVSERNTLSIPLNIVARLLIVQASSTPSNNFYEMLTAQNFISFLAPNIPSELLRTLTPQYVLGIHGYDENQMFLIMGVDSYQQGYAGMLKWEPRMQRDLVPLFTRTPPARFEENIPTATIATSSIQAFEPVFTDAVIENFDSRVIQDENGDTLLLWTFLDPYTIIITTNEYTLREILSRRTGAPDTIE